MSKEILTLQFGTVSNFVGSHFWNLQEELRYQHLQLGEDQVPERDVSVLYRTNSSRKKGAPLMVPRVVIFDYSEDYGYLSAKTCGYSKESIYHQHEKIKYLNSVASNVTASSGSGIELFVQDPGRGPSQYHQYISDMSFNPSEPLYKHSKKSKKYDDDYEEEEEEEGEEKEIKEEDVEVTNYRQFRLDESKDEPSEEKKDEKLRNHDSVHKQFESGAFSKFWSDYGKATYHPRSLQIFCHKNEKGNSISLSSTEWEEVQDHARFFLEECDQFAGVMNICDTSHLSYANQYIQRLQDDIGKKNMSVMSFQVSDEKIPDLLSNVSKKYNAMFPVEFMDYMDLSTVVVPLNIQSVNDDTNFLLFSKDHYQPSMLYHPTSVLATSISSFLEPVMLSNRKHRMTTREYLRLFPVLPIQKLALPSMSFPLPIRKNTDTLYGILDTMSPLHQSNQMYGISGFSPHDEYNKSTERSVLSQAVVSKGMKDLPLYKSLTDGKENLTLEEKIVELFRREVLKKNIGDQDSNRRRKILDNCQSNKEMFSRYLRQTRTYSSYGYFSDNPFYVSDSFPQYFSSDVDEDGYLAGNEKKKEDKRVRVLSLPMLTAFQNSSESAMFMKDQMLKETTSNLKRIVHGSNGEKELEEVVEYTENMTKYVESYE